LEKLKILAVFGSKRMNFQYLLPEAVAWVSPRKKFLGLAEKSGPIHH